MKRYFMRFGNQWIWQVYYDDQINYASCGKNFFLELFDYILTCRRARKEYLLKYTQP